MVKPKPNNAAGLVTSKAWRKEFLKKYKFLTVITIRPGYIFGAGGYEFEEIESQKAKAVFGYILKKYLLYKAKKIRKRTWTDWKALSFEGPNGRARLRWTEGTKTKISGSEEELQKLIEKIGFTVSIVNTEVGLTVITITA